MIRAAFYAAILLALAGIYGLGYSAGGDRELARGSAEQAASRAQEFERRVGRLQAQQQSLARSQAEERRLTAELDAARAATRIVYRTIRKEIPHAASDLVAAPLQLAVSADPAGATACAFGPTFVELWDAASDPARAALRDPAGNPAAPPGAAGAAAGVDAEALLANHVDNAELGTEAREQLNALIDWHLEHDLVPAHE